MKKIIIIKLGALGDVVRTLAILPVLKEKYPDSHITWVTKKDSLELLYDNLYVDEVLEPTSDMKEKFDILYSFDIEPEATKLAQEISATDKYGFYSQEGFPSAFNIMAEYYLNTLFDDELKKKNKKTYQEMMFEAAELEWNKQHCPIFLNDMEREYAQEFVRNKQIRTEKLIGIHMGASPRWPSKVWHKEELKKFIMMAKKQGYDVLLFGGPNEIEEQKKIIKDLENEGIEIFQNNPKNTIRQFTALIDICQIMVCADSLALHLSLAMKKPTIGLFFCTSPWEIEDYGLLSRIIAPAILDFFPERMNEYNEELTRSIKAEQVLKEVDRFFS